MKYPIIVIVSILLFSISMGGCALEKSRPAQSAAISHSPSKNIILITISSLRADHTGLSGYHRDTTPHLDEFARQNTTFTQAFATSGWMMPAHASILTGLYPRDHQVTHISKKLNEQFITLPEILSNHGYYCAGFCCNPRLSNDYGFGQGFDSYDDYSVDIILESLAFETEKKMDINARRTNGLINDAVIRWLRNNTHQPFFLFVHYYDNHWDYLPPPPYDKMYAPDYHGDITGREIAREPLFSNPPADDDIDHIIALYDGEIRQTDQDLGEMLEFLRNEGKFEDSVIIIAGDHGEQFYEHGHTSHHGIFDELIHIPLVVSVPDFNEPGTMDCLVSGVDIMPTILDFASIIIPSECKGNSLVSLIKGKTEKQRDFVFVEYTGGAAADSYAARFERYKFVSQEGDIFAYDLQEDEFEQKKIYKNDFNNQMNELFKTVEHLLKQNLPGAK